MRTLLGLALSGLPALAMAYVGEEFDPDSLPAAMGLYIGGTALGGMLGRLLSGLLSDLGGWTLALGGIAALGMVALSLFVWLLPASRHFKAQPLSLTVLLANFRLHLSNPVLRSLFLQGFLLMGASSRCSITLASARPARHSACLPRSSVCCSSSISAAFSVPAGQAVWCRARCAAGSARRRGAHAARRRAMRNDRLASIVVGLGVFTLGFFAAHAVASGGVGSHAQARVRRPRRLYLCAYYLGSSVVGYGAGYVWDHAGWHPLMALLAGLFVMAGWRARAL